MTKEIKKYWALFICILFSIVIIPFFLSSGGVTSDSISYFQLAEDLPAVNHNLFPIGYPILLKIIGFLTNDYFYSSKIISAFGIILIGVFSYYKKFYFRETVILLTFRVFFILYTYSYSESVFITLMYFLLYYFHQYFSGKIKNINFVLPASLIMIYMVMVRYSGVYVHVAICLYLLFYTIKNKFFPIIFSKGYFYYILLSSLGIAGYLIFNYSNFGSLFGEDIRLEPNIRDFWEFTYTNFLGVINIVNPIFSMKILNVKNNLFLTIEIIIIIIDLLFIIFFVFFYKKYFKKQLTSFHQMLLTIGVVYLLLMVVSEYKQDIEYLNTRMLCESSFVFFFSFLILLYKNFPEKTKWFFLLGCISIVYNVVYLMKSPTNYLSNKAKIESVLKEKKGVKYFYDDIENVKIISIYTIPFLNKKLEYAHPYFQLKEVNYNILGTIQPHIKLLKKEDLIKDKSLILYNSEIK